MLQKINRARANGTTEMVLLGNTGKDVNEGSPVVGPDPWVIQNINPPLAWSTALSTAAQGHANNLQTVDWFFNGSTYGGSPHNPNSSFPGGASTSSSRITAAGYSNTYSGCRTSTPNHYLPGPENISMGVASPSNGWTNAEKLVAFNTSHEGLFEDFTISSRGHRSTMLYECYKEIGLGSSTGTDVRTSDSTTWDAYYIVQNFGNSSTSSQGFFTGLAYNDIVVDSFYTPNSGESIAGLTVQALQSGVVIGSTAAFDTGGYSLRMAAGTYELRFVKSDGSYHSAGNYVIGSSNVEVNVKNPVFIQTFSGWINTFPGAASAPGFLQDADNDGIANGIEHVLGSSPSATSSGMYQVSATGTSMKFRHPQTNSLATTVTTAYQWSSDLQNWYASGVTNPAGIRATISESTITNTSAPSLDVIEVTTAVTAGANKKVFTRMTAATP